MINGLRPGPSNQNGTITSSFAFLPTNQSTWYQTIRTAQFRPIRNVCFENLICIKWTKLGKLGKNLMKDAPPPPAPCLSGRYFWSSTRGCVSMVCKLFTWIKCLLSAPRWEFLTFYRGNHCPGDGMHHSHGCLKHFFFSSQKLKPHRLLFDMCLKCLNILPTFSLKFFFWDLSVSRSRYSILTLVY